MKEFLKLLKNYLHDSLQVPISLILHINYSFVCPFHLLLIKISYIVLFTIYYDGKLLRVPENNMKYEVEHFIRMIQDQEQNQLHTQRSLDAMKLMDEIRRQCQISFPADK